MKKQVRHSLLTAMLPEKKRFQVELMEMEKKLAAAGDFETAMRARDERMALDQEIAAIERELVNTPSSGMNLPDKIELALNNAQFSGVTLDTAEKALINWQQPNATASWTLPNLPPGGYEVQLTYKAAVPTALLANESFYTVKSVVPASQQQEPGSTSLGTLKVSKGDGSLTLSLTAPSKEARQFKVYAVTLKPAAP